MVTDVPPEVEPEVGEIEVMTGAVGGGGGEINVNWSADEVVEVPPGVVTVTSTVPADSAGEVAVKEVDEL